MTLTQLLRRNLIFHRRGNLAVLLGVAVGTAVLTGALLVGDSLRGSLHDRALRQIGWVERALVSGRFLRQPAPPSFKGGHVDPGITLRASAERAGADDTTERRVGGITVWATRDDLMYSWYEPVPPLQRLIERLPFVPNVRRDPNYTWQFPQIIQSGDAWVGAE